MKSTLETTTKKALLCTLLGLSLFFGYVTTCLAAQVTIFGPETFVRGTDAPATVERSFVLPAGVSLCNLSVTGANGGPLAANNVSVKVNGTEMVTSKDLRGDNTQKESVILGRENTLTVVLKGKPGDQVTVHITGEAQTSPPVTPQPGQPRQ